MTGFQVLIYAGLAAFSVYIGAYWWTAWVFMVAILGAIVKPKTFFTPE